jgi:NitT/TauT family transport system substrate-binding protein
MIESGVLERKMPFDEYVDVRFAERAQIQTAWKFEPGASVNE